MKSEKKQRNANAVILVFTKLPAATPFMKPVSDTGFHYDTRLAASKECHEQHDDKQYRAKNGVDVLCSRMSLEERGLNIGTKRRDESSCGETSRG